MIKRIVKLTFKLEHISDFQSLFECVKNDIRSFQGCRHLELWQSIDDERVFFTYSYWDRPTDLEYYRVSDLFKNTWSKTKVLFDGKPEAWSIKVQSEVPH